MRAFLRSPDLRAGPAVTGWLLVLAALVLSSGAAAPGTARASPGVRLGIQQLNTSGQVGDVTLFPGRSATTVAIRLLGSNGRRESAGIYRARTCTSTGAGPRAYALKSVSPTGLSRSTVHASLSHLRSGDYVVVVFASTKAGARSVACGHLS